MNYAIGIGMQARVKIKNQQNRERKYVLGKCNGNSSESFYLEARFSVSIITM